MPISMCEAGMPACGRGPRAQRQDQTDPVRASS